MSLSPEGHGFHRGAQAAAAREIALAFGVPPMLLGIPGDNTYANYQEANRVFWRQTVLPLIGAHASQALTALAGAGLRRRSRLELDLDRIDALAARARGAVAPHRRRRFPHRDEKREAVGYGHGQAARVAESGRS